MERYVSLRKAAREAGIARSTLKLWLAQDLSLVLPPVRRGSKVLLRMSDVEFVMRKRMARKAPTQPQVVHRKIA